VVRNFSRGQKAATHIQVLEELLIQSEKNTDQR
jgi:hypothetical protein